MSDGYIIISAFLKQSFDSLSINLSHLASLFMQFRAANLNIIHFLSTTMHVYIPYDHMKLTWFCWILGT